MTKAPLAPYPALRLRRLRQADWIAASGARDHADAGRPDLVGGGARRARAACRWPRCRASSAGRVAEAAKAAKEARALGIPAIAIFPTSTPRRRTPRAPAAADPDGLVCRAVQAMKDAAPEVGVMCDVALDPFTEHGHDGMIEGGRILNDATIERLVEQGLVQADGRLRHPRARPT